MLVRHMVMTAVVLGLFAVIGTGVVALTFKNTEQRAAQNELEALLESLHALVPPDMHDNDLQNDTVTVTSQELLGSKNPVTVYRARKNGEAVAAILTPVAPDGYNGDIKLLVAIRTDGRLLGVRVVSDRETPGLGDNIHLSRTNWLRSFDGKSLADPGGLGWRVVKDGGIFDQFTGATITPRAVVKAVHNTLKFFQQNKTTLFRAKQADSESEDNG